MNEEKFEPFKFAGWEVLFMPPYPECVFHINCKAQGYITRSSCNPDWKCIRCGEEVPKTILFMHKLSRSNL